MPRQDKPIIAAPSWMHYALIGAVAAVVAFYRLGSATLDDHECYLALAARTMADDKSDSWLVPGVLGPPGQYVAYEVPADTPLHRWMVPVNNGRPRLGKTPLPYWLVAIPAKVGLGVTQWTARLPAAVSAVLLAWVTLAMGRRLLSARAALLGTLILATCVGFFKWGRNARPEMLLCLLMTAAMACFYLGVESRTRRGQGAWMLAFWAVLGLANLAKEFVPLLLAWPLAAFLLWRKTAEAGDDAAALRTLRKFLIFTGAGLGLYVLITGVRRLQWWAWAGVDSSIGTYATMAAAFGVPMAWYLLRSRPWRQVRPLLGSGIVGAILMCAIFLPWLWYMHRLFPSLVGGVLSEEVYERAAGGGEWSFAEPYYYLAPLAVFTLPWAPLLPGALAAPLMRRFAERRAGLVFLLLWCVGIVALFTASAVKREHYILPMLPAMCLLMGFLAEDVFARHAWIPQRLASGFRAYGLAAVAAVLGAAVMALVKRDFPWLCVLIITTAAAVPMVLLLVPRWGRRRWFAFAAIAGSAVVAYVGFAAGGAVWDSYACRADFARLVATAAPSGTVWHWQEPKEEFRAEIPFYFGRTIPALQWHFARQEPKAAAEEIDRRVVDWLRAHGDEAPWIIAYQGGKEDDIAAADRAKRIDASLRSLGYRAIWQTPDAKGKGLLMVLYSREQTGPAATKP